MCHSARTARHFPAPAVAEVCRPLRRCEALLGRSGRWFVRRQATPPHCPGAIRTRRALGWSVKWRGGVRATASPSTPAGTVPLASTRSDRALHARPAWCGGTWRVDHDDPQLAAVEHGTCSANRRALERVGVVGHQHHRGTQVLGSAVIDEVHVGRGRAGAERLLLRGLEQRAQLGVAVARLSDRVRVYPERDVVQKWATVHVAEVDRPVPAQRRTRRARRRDRSGRRRHRGRSGCAYRRGYTQMGSGRRPQPPPRLPAIHRPPRRRERRRRWPAPPGSNPQHLGPARESPARCHVLARRRPVWLVSPSRPQKSD